MLRGKVRWFNADLGFGFLTSPTGDDVYTHYSVIAVSGFKELRDGQDVDYEMERGPKGLKATVVHPVVDGNL